LVEELQKFTRKRWSYGPQQSDTFLQPVEAQRG